MQAAKKVEIKVDKSKTYQTIDGFGVNINSKYWDGGKLLPVMKMLVDDLGATIYRLDAYGKSNWVDPHNQFDNSVINPQNLKRIYDEGIDFKNALGMAKFLNSRKIEPYITLSGIVPKWMCGQDGVTLEKFDLYAEMAVSYLVWLRKKGIKFTLFGPQNETDIGPPEGPKADPKTFLKMTEAVIDKLDAHHLKDVKLVVAEQAYYSLNYVKPLFASSKVRNRIAAVGVHCYSDYDPSSIVEFVKKQKHPASVWMSEYGDLDQSGEREWYVAWLIFQRLMRLLEAGMTGALNWDAYDNYHDHDEFWCIYGLIRTALRTFTPKKRFYACKQMYRFVKPGFVRIGALPSTDQLTVQAYASPDFKQVSIVGRYSGTEPTWLGIRAPDIDQELKKKDISIYRTSETANCSKEQVSVLNKWGWPDVIAEVELQPHTIFTVTNVE